jgi:hypothetical protein
MTDDVLEAVRAVVAEAEQNFGRRFGVEPSTATLRKFLCGVRGRHPDATVRALHAIASDAQHTLRHYGPERLESAMLAVLEGAHKRAGKRVTTGRSRGAGGRQVLVLLSAEEHDRLSEWAKATGGRALSAVLREAALTEAGGE